MVVMDGYSYIATKFTINRQNMRDINGQAIPESRNGITPYNSPIAIC